MHFSTFFQGLISLSLLAKTSCVMQFTPRLPLPSKTVYQFPNKTWLESIEARSNGNILFSTLNPPEIYILDPSAHPPKAKLLNTIPGVTNLLGLTEVSPDIFAIVAGNLSTANAGIPHSFSIWTIDFNIITKSGPKVSKAASLPDAGLLNGLAILPGVPHTILIADSTLGAVWKLNTKTGTKSIAIQIPEMLAPPPPAFYLGINGLRVRGSYLYFTNSGAVTFSRVKITAEGTLARGAKVETIVTGDTLFDDFAFDVFGTAYVNTNTGNNIVAVGLDGKSVSVAGALDQLTLAGGTAAVFGRGKSDGKTLYVSTSGGSSAPVNGTLTEPGKVVAIDTTGFRI